MGVSQNVHCGPGRLDSKSYAIRCFKFWKSVYNVVLRTVFSCVVNSQCHLYVSVMCMNFSELACVVYEHFRTSTM